MASTAFINIREIMKHIISIIFGGGLAYIQSMSFNQNPDFIPQLKPVMFHFVITTVFFFIAGLIVNFTLLKNSEDSEFGSWKIGENFSFILATTLGIGIFGVFNGNDSFMSLIAPYFGFSMAVGLVTGKVISVFYSRIFTRK